MSTPNLLRAARKASLKRFAADAETPSAFTALDGTPTALIALHSARDIHVTEHEALLHQLSTLYAQAYGVSLAIAALPSTYVADLANERMGDALVSIEEAQSLMREFYLP